MSKKDSVDQHPLWDIFLTDPRVIFLCASKCIDMVFDDMDVGLFLEGDCMFSPCRTLAGWRGEFWRRFVGNLCVARQWPAP
ncbi:hypothetical protein, partial [Delftia sp. WSY_14]|uniref:hypothetical protein n=1 Tax=unclassified Delftia TaxID=2613839 RepID=UPI00370B94C8